jgi:hypothetical protein
MTSSISNVYKALYGFDERIINYYYNGAVVTTSSAAQIPLLSYHTSERRGFLLPRNHHQLPLRRGNKYHSPDVRVATQTIGLRVAERSGSDDYTGGRCLDRIGGVLFCRQLDREYTGGVFVWCLRLRYVRKCYHGPLSRWCD